MSLEEQLDAIRTGAAERIPPEALAIMHRATDDLRSSGILDRVPGPGDKAPDFELENWDGERVESRLLRTKGPLVVTFYRGVW